MTTDQLRVMGVTISGAFSGADRAIFDALGEQGILIGEVNAPLPMSLQIANIVRSFNIERRQWARSWRRLGLKSPEAFLGRSRTVDRKLRASATDFDIVLHVSGLFSPFIGTYPRPVAIFCDYTTRLAELNYTPWFGLDPENAKAWYRLEAELYTNAACVLTASENTRRSIINDYGVEPERTAVVFEGVHHLPPARTSRAEDPTLLFVGIDFERKGGRFLLDAFRQIRHQVPAAKLLIAGPKPGAKQPGVEWLGRVGSRTELEVLYNSATAFVMPSICEPFGLALIEAMSHGLPVIGTQVDAMGEIIEEGETGYLVPPGNASALVQPAVTLLQDPERSRAMGVAGRERVAAQFMWKHTVERITRELERVAGKSIGVQSSGGSLK